MKSNNLFLITILLLFINAALSLDCFWDSECNSGSTRCCVNNQCLDSDSCRRIRTYPKENFQVCYVNSDCVSGCCHNNFCTMIDTCNSGDSLVPLVFFLVVLGLALFLLLFILIKDVLKFKKNKAHN